MNTSTFRETLANQIEQLVRAEMVGIRSLVAAAVDRALSSSAVSTAPTSGGKRRIQGQSKRRPRAEVAALGERFWVAVAARPGLTMATLAPEIGSTSRDLQLPVSQLKRSGRLRSAGHRHLTKYFPSAGPSTEPS